MRSSSLCLSAMVTSSCTNQAHASTLVLWLAPGLILVMGLWVWIKMGKLTRARADLPSDGNDLSGNERRLLSGGYRGS